MIRHVDDKFLTNFYILSLFFFLLTLRFLWKMDPGNSKLGTSNLGSSR